MKTLLIAVAAASLMLGACSSSKTSEEAKTPSVSVEEAIAQCQQASGANQDRAVFDACMKTKATNAAPLKVVPLLLHLPHNKHS